jgi:hypothetical protein
MSGLTTRHFQRQEIDRPMELAIAEDQRDQVRFSSRSGSVCGHVIAGRAVDVSPGGLGVKIQQFLPRMAEGVLRVFDAESGSVSADGMARRAVAFEHRVKVRRIVMCGHEPTYLVGLSFIDPSADLDRRVRALTPAASAGATDARAGGRTHA